MSRTVSILGVGETGGHWARDFLAAGWRVRVFDPYPEAEGLTGIRTKIERASTISSCVSKAHWVIVAVPGRLELVQTVIQRAQAEAPRDAVVAVTSLADSIDAIQSSALRPGQVVHVGRQDNGGFDMNVTQRNSDDFRQEAVLALSEISAVRTIGADYVPPVIRDDAASA